MSAFNKSLLLLILLLFAAPANAGEFVSRLGAEMKMLSSPAGMGLLFGWRYLFQTSQYLSFGGAGATGQTGIGDSGSYSYGGMLASLHIPVTPLSTIELSFLGGGGGGRAGDGTSFGGTLVEPALGVAFQVGKAVQFVASGSYLWMPGSAQGTGITGGVRFEFLLDHHTEPAVAASREVIREVPRTRLGSPLETAPAPAATSPRARRERETESQSWVPPRPSSARIPASTGN